MASLHQFEVRASRDAVKRDPELFCTRCGTHLCDIEPLDTLDVLVGVAENHECTSERIPEPAEAP